MKTIIEWLPKGLKVLRLGGIISTNKLPEGLIFLYLECLSKYDYLWFNTKFIPVSTTNLISIQPLALPSPIRSISFNDNFNSNLNDSRLLSNIEYIELGKSFHSPFDVPSTIKTFKLTSNVSGFFLYNADFNECYSLTNLEFGRSDNPNLENNNFPNS
ncbi:hypothetical protein ACTFIT_004120 [Dictyostelium discoideum]